jgi:hypothetical protein
MNLCKHFARFRHAFRDTAIFLPGYRIGSISRYRLVQTLDDALVGRRTES